MYHARGPYATPGQYQPPGTPYSTPGPYYYESEEEAEYARYTQIYLADETPENVRGMAEMTVRMARIVGLTPRSLVYCTMSASR